MTYQFIDDFKNPFKEFKHFIHVITVNDAAYKHMYRRESKVRLHVREWLEKYVGKEFEDWIADFDGYVAEVYGIGFLFKKKQDAMLFKVVWY